MLLTTTKKRKSSVRRSTLNMVCRLALLSTLLSFTSVVEFHMLADFAAMMPSFNTWSHLAANYSYDMFDGVNIEYFRKSHRQIMHRYFCVVFQSLSGCTIILYCSSKINGRVVVSLKLLCTKDYKFRIILYVLFKRNCLIGEEFSFWCIELIHLYEVP